MPISESGRASVRRQRTLLRICVLDESHHQLSIQQLAFIRDTLMKHNYEDLQEFAETARGSVKDAQRAVKDAREALDHHTAEHGC